jgi:HlyD family secretion protein
MPKPIHLVSILILAAGCGGAYWVGRSASPQPPQRDEHQTTVKTNFRIDARSVSALGTLEPAGEVHVLAGPMTQLGGAPRIKSISVQEGERVSRNQILATFDNTPQIRSEKARIIANIESKKTEIRILKSQTKRFEALTKAGSFPVAELEERKARLAGYESQLQELIGSLKTSHERLLSDTVIRAPIDGIVLRVNARVGERAQENGVFEVGNTTIMQAVVQVEEGDIGAIKKGQAASVQSENGAFSGILHGTVSSIGMRVKAKRRLGRDPSRDPDPEERIIEVRIDLDSPSSQRVKNLTGVTVMAVILVS